MGGLFPRTLLYSSCTIPIVQQASNYQKSAVIPDAYRSFHHTILEESAPNTIHPSIRRYHFTPHKQNESTLTNRLRERIALPCRTLSVSSNLARSFIASSEGLEVFRGARSLADAAVATSVPDRPACSLCAFPTAVAATLVVAVVVAL